VDRLTEVCDKQKKIFKKVIDIKNKFREEHKDRGFFTKHATIANQYLTELDNALTF